MRVHWGTDPGGNDMDSAATKYAEAGDIQIAYQVHGDGANALIVVPGLISHIEMHQEMPEYCTWLKMMAEHFKVIIYDKRGQGLSDRNAGVPGPEQRMDDITAIANAEDLEKFSLFGYSEGAATAILYAASFPTAYGQSPSLAVSPGFRIVKIFIYQPTPTKL